MRWCVTGRAIPTLATRWKIRASPSLTHPTPTPDSRFPIPNSLLPITYSRFPVPCSLFPVPSLTTCPFLPESD
ncbi:MAG: hypothetical protein F6K26_15715 [Moorea sp. SIO2I5]|nr:hypothetical protein [Moorena sp. SIO2I5]